MVGRPHKVWRDMLQGEWPLYRVGRTAQEEEEEIKLHPFMAWLIWEFKKTSSEAEGGGLYFQRVEMALASSLWYSGKS